MTVNFRQDLGDKFSFLLYYALYFITRKFNGNGDLKNTG